MSFDRPARPLTYDLGNHAKAYLEAEQYSAGYAFLDSLLTANTAISTPANRYDAYIAQAPQLALASSLIVYPLITTKAKTPDQLRGSNAALRYLRNVQATVSPLHENLTTAFSFPTGSERTRRGTVNHRAAAGDSPSSDNDYERIEGKAAGEQSLWLRAEDFWCAVGWAFNCSVLHKKRWERWRLWLELMLGFLESGWEAQVRRGKQEGVDKEAALKESLIWRYISSDDPTKGVHRKRMIRAILARGTRYCKSRFPEVWRGETTERVVTDPRVKPLAVIDIENDQYGEFLAVDDDELIQDAPSTSTRPSRRNRTNGLGEEHSSKSEGEAVTPHDTETAITQLGGVDAINLRQRLIALLARVSEALPKDFIDVDNFFDPITDEYAELPTMLFSVLISTSKLPGPRQIALNANLALPLLSGQLPDYTIIYPTQSHLETLYLPHQSSSQSYFKNARVSLIIEQTFLYMMHSNLLTATDALRKALEKGVDERNSIYGTAKGKKGNAEEEQVAKRVLEASGERLHSLLEVLEMMTGKPPQPPRKKSEAFSFISTLSELSSPPDSDSE